MIDKDILFVWYGWFLAQKAEVMIKNNQVYIKGDEKGHYVLCREYLPLGSLCKETYPFVVRRK